MIQNTVLKDTKMNIGGKSMEKKKNMQEKRKLIRSNLFPKGCQLCFFLFFTVTIKQSGIHGLQWGTGPSGRVHFRGSYPVRRRCTGAAGNPCRERFAPDF
ncbi:MAG: hypothetical protein LBP50_04950 [Tannerella sp.]|jgi:hypothetical protein|nr:hypothetical protein [Tannerella sp.]